MLNVTVDIGWKFVLALGVAIGIDILATKMDGPSAERVLTETIDTCKESVAAAYSKR